MWNKKIIIIQMNLFRKQKETHSHRKQTYGYQNGKGFWGRDKLGSLLLNRLSFYVSAFLFIKVENAHGHTFFFFFKPSFLLSRLENKLLSRKVALSFERGKNPNQFSKLRVLKVICVSDQMP